jgi:uncharacterized membrane protein
MNKSYIIKLKKIFTNEYFFLFLILFLGLALRLVNLKAEPFWNDEFLSLSIVKHYQNDSIGLINYLQENEFHPPLYYLLLKNWVGLFGYGTAAVRSLSVIFGLATIYLTYYAGKIFFSSKQTALLASLFVSVLPIQIEYSQEARPYAMLCFFALLAIIFLWKYFQTDRIRHLLFYSLACIIGLYLHYSFTFIPLAAGLFWLAWLVYHKKFNSKNFIKFLACNSLIFIGFFWWFPYLIYGKLLANDSFFNLIPKLNDSRDPVFFELYLNEMIWNSRAKFVLTYQILLIISFKLALSAASLLLIFKDKDRWEKFLTKLGGFSYLFWLSIAVLLFFLFSPQASDYSYHNERHIIFISVFLCLDLAWLISNLKYRQALLISTLFLSSLLLFIAVVIENDFNYDYGFRYCATAEYINKNFRPGDLVIDYSSHFRTALNFCLDEKISSEGFRPVTLLNWQDDYLASRETLGFIESRSQVLREMPGWDKFGRFKINYLLKKYQPQRIWLVSQISEPTLQGAKIFDDFLSGRGWKKINTPQILRPLDLYQK